MDKKTNPFDRLEKVFHEPKRLAIMSTLCGAGDGVCFSALKQHCDLTDGNLNRHLKTLEAAGAVAIVKDQGAAGKTRKVTLIYLTETGRKGFHDYLHSLESVLATAVEALDAEAASHKAPLEVDGSLGQFA